MAVAAASTKNSNLVPRQDSNLRSRLRRPVLFTAVTWQNAPFPSGWGACGERRIRTAGLGCSHIFRPASGPGGARIVVSSGLSTNSGAGNSQQTDDADRLAAASEEAEAGP